MLPSPSTVQLNSIFTANKLSCAGTSVAILLKQLKQQKSLFDVHVLPGKRLSDLRRSTRVCPNQALLHSALSPLSQRLATYNRMCMSLHCTA